MRDPYQDEGSIPGRGIHTNPYQDGGSIPGGIHTRMRDPYQDEGSIPIHTRMRDPYQEERSIPGFVTRTYNIQLLCVFTLRPIV